MQPVEVFKTNVDKPRKARQLVMKLVDHFPQCKINFDLEDCDRILRVQGKEIYPEKIAELLGQHGYHCEILPG